jgi:hypothetical protein
MLFTTTTFAFLFLPVALAGCDIVRQFGHSGPAIGLVLSSVFCYGCRMVEFTLLRHRSIARNFLVGQRICYRIGTKSGRTTNTSVRSACTSL